MANIRLYDVRWVSHTAGPSPIKNQFGPNCRTELFFMGCHRGASGNPCPGCFNPKLWETVPGARELQPTEMAEHIEKHAPQKYITIVGGEPWDQAEGLVELCEELKNRDFHIIVFTSYQLYKICPGTFPGIRGQYSSRLLKNCDIIVDGMYEQDQRIYDESYEDGFHNAVGSGNQVIWDCSFVTTNEDGLITRYPKGIPASAIAGLYLGTDNVLKFITKTDTPWWVKYPNSQGPENNTENT